MFLFPPVTALTTVVEPTMPSQPIYRSVSSDPDNSGPSSAAGTSSQRREWRTGVFRRLPWTGLLSILLALGFAVAAVCLVVACDGKPIDFLSVNGYKFQPTVLLSVFATLANALLIYSFTQGATIHWWRTGFGGTTLRQLHSSYHFGSGVTAVFSSVTAFNVVALASLMMPLLLADGPLLQRSISVVQKMQVSRSAKQIPISAAPFIQGSTGILIGICSSLRTLKLL